LFKLIYFSNLDSFSSALLGLLRKAYYFKIDLMKDTNVSLTSGNVLDKAENYIKYIAGIPGYIAAIGYPAAYNYKRWRI